MTLRRLGGVGLVVLVALVGLAAFSGSAAAAAPTCAGDGTDFADGDGSSATPYEITTVQQLQCMNHTAHLGANFILTGDVDASDTSTWNGGDGFSPIGENVQDEFTGSFDGQGHTIADLTINRGNDKYVGLFGSVNGGSIENVGLENVVVTGHTYVGGLVGFIWSGSVTGSYVTGSVNGQENVGGVVGGNTGDVTDSYADVTVDSATDTAGGLVGLNQNTVTSSYATGTVTGGSNVGGLVGQSGQHPVTDSYWDEDASGEPSSDGGTGLTTTQMQRFAPAATMDGFDFDATWTLTDGYPRLQWEGVAAITVDSIDAADTTVIEAEAGTITVTANEGGGHAGQGVTVEVTNADGLSGLSNGDTAVTDANGEVNFQFAESDTGIYSPEFAWEDDAAVSDTTSVTVNADLTPPNADAGANQTVDEDTQVAFDGTGSTDAVGAITDYAWDFDDGGGTATGAQPSHTFTEPGTYVVELTVTDVGGNTDTDPVTITVEDVTAPTADASNSPGAGNEDSSITFDGTASTDNVGVTGYEWDWTTDGVFDDTGSNPAHTYADPGTYTVTLRVTDAAGHTDTTTHTVTVADVTAPSADAGPNQTVTEDTQVDFDGTASTDNDNIASYAWDFADAGATATGSQPSHTFADPGTYVVELTVTDGGANTDTDTITITVEDVTAPTADAGPNQTVNENTAVSFNGSNSTDNGNIASYAWNFDDGATATGSQPSHTFADPGTYTVNLTVTDGGGNVDTDSLVVTVNDTTAPTADAGSNLTVDEDTQVDFDASNSTDNGVVATYEWSFGDGSNATGVAPTHTYTEPGAYSVDLTVTDTGGNNATDSMLVTVEDVTNPTADAGNDTSADEDAVVSFNASNSTDNGVIATYEWDFGDGANATGATPTHTYSQPGTYLVNLTVTDTAGNNATDMLTVTVQAITTDDDDDDGDSGGGGGGSGGGAAGQAHQFSFVLVNGAGSTAIDASIVNIEVDFAAADASGTVLVGPFAERPTDANPIPDASGLAFVDVTVPSALADSEATMLLTLDAGALGDVEPADLTIYHYDDGEWTALETSVVSTANGVTTIKTTTPGFSLFAVGHSAQQETPERTEMTTTSPTTLTPSPTTTPGPMAPPTPATSTTESTGQPGFGIGATVLALLAAIATTIRRRS